MKTPMMTTALTLGFAVALSVSASAQLGGKSAPQPATRGGTASTTYPPQGASSRGMFGNAPATAKTGNAPRDPNVLRSSDQVPEPISLDEIKAPKIGPLAEPIDAYLLQKEHGPFMVSAYTFQGPEAAKYAQILAMELRHEYNLPAYIWFVKVQPMHSNIQGIQPTAPDHARNGDMAPPERLRTHDEAAVLVGNCKTIDESEKLLKQVKKIVPGCLKQFPVIYQNRRGKGLNRAIMTTNPFQASQNLYPGKGVPTQGPAMARQGQKFDPFAEVVKFEQARKVDPLVLRMNSGPASLFKNPSAFTLQVAEYTGRAHILPSGATINDNTESLKKSPLQTAADDAENLAEAINKCRSMNGLKAYVFHTRFSSMVTVGGFNSPNDPNFKKVYDQMQVVSNELIQRRFSQIALRPSESPMQVPKAK